MADFQYPKLVQKYCVLIGSKFFQKTCSDSNPDLNIRVRDWYAGPYCQTLYKSICL